MTKEHAAKRTEAFSREFSPLFEAGMAIVTHAVARFENSETTRQVLRAMEQAQRTAAEQRAAAAAIAQSYETAAATVDQLGHTAVVTDFPPSIEQQAQQIVHEEGSVGDGAEAIANGFGQKVVPENAEALAEAYRMLDAAHNPANQDGFQGAFNG